MTFRRNKKGQMAVLIALSFGLLFLLVAMVVNIGFLVAAKINLQNAVDLAAYAGAAQQARYLSEIGKWNYEMRRNYKAMVFDYMIVLNGERKFDKNATGTPAQIAVAQNFKTYITTGTGTAGGEPSACVSLQRQGRASVHPTGWRAQLTRTCQDMQTLNYQNVLNQLQTNVNNLNTIQQASCANLITFNSCANTLTLLGNMGTAQGNINEDATDKENAFANYVSQPYNYNRRLIAWMVHDYRHLQTRIRGVHFGDISIGTYNSNPTASTGRWLLQKDDHPTIFKNSPISVAAKVLNGYTAIEGSAPTGGSVIPLTSDALKNPIHNAAYATFKKNLINVLADNEANPRLYHLVPKTTGGSSSSKGMASGCSGTCPEFNGSYLRLDNHDIDFWVTYMVMKQDPSGQKIFDYEPPKPEPVTHFPVGVAKDIRIQTYYAVVGTASTKKIPFNVFFGDSTTSQEATLVAVAAARPFGSRIGPFIDANCENLYSGASKVTCEKNGLDYLYPFLSSPADVIPNFSLQVGNADDSQKLGVKLCVNKDEYGGSKPAPYPSGMWGVNDIQNNEVHSFIYQITMGKKSRWRVYTDPNDTAMNTDDGFMTKPTTITLNPNSSSNKYFDSDTAYTNGPVHPLGTRDSVVAWSGITTPPTISSNPQDKDNYETYLDKYKGAAIYQFSQQIDKRESDNGGKYKVYVFRYPVPQNMPNAGWDYTLGGVTSVQPAATNGDQMIERAFANAMAVNQFEVLRYIIPYRNPNLQSSIDADVMNYITDPVKNSSAYIFGGLGPSSRDKAPATTSSTDNVPFGGQSPPGGKNNLVMDEGANEVLGNFFPESYAAWRFGSRGYRVKLVNIQDLLGKNNQSLQNPLEQSYTLPDQDVSVDLSKIKY